MVDPLYESGDISGEEVAKLTRAIYALIMEMEPVSVEEVAAQAELPLARTRTLIEHFGAE
jgi:uncharacterized protein YfkK (UPF0435 family)